MPRTTQQQISFADWELLQQGIELEPVLQNISDFLDNHAEMVEAVRQDLERGLKNPRAGRSRLSPSQVLRSLTLRKVLERTRKMRSRNLLTELWIGELRKEIDRYCKLGDRVIDQARRRVLEGEQVPHEEKIFSIFEAHTDLIKRGKILTPVEFGHKVFLAESAQGLITQYEVLEGNPPDEQQVEASLECHKENFRRAPKVYSGDRGFYSEENERSCKCQGVRKVCLPQRGGKKTARRTALEKSPDFKKGQRFRAGIEGTISVLFRGRGMKRCLAEGRQRFEVWVGAAVLANNLMRIADLLDERSSRKRKAA